MKRGIKMALINCPECAKEISDKAISCPHCGYPIQNLETSKTDLICPSFPADLSIGSQVVNWTYNAVIDGVYENSGSNDIIESGKVKVILYTQGLEIRRNAITVPYIQINYSQIISVSEIKGTELKDKSVIGRAVVGGVILGPVGAVVGGMSGIGEKYVKSYILIISYWDIPTRSTKTISVACATSSSRFIEKLYEELNSYISGISQDSYTDTPMVATEEERNMIRLMRNNKNKPEFKEKSDEELLQILKESKKNSSCFVATVVYNNNNCIEVNKLRIWRDTKLNKTARGRLFVKLYYKYGEKLSLIIKPHTKVCDTIRHLLDLFIERI